MTSFVTGKSASSSVSKGKSVSSGSFKTASQSSSSRSQSGASSFKVGAIPKSAFSSYGSKLTTAVVDKSKSSFSTSGAKASSFSSGEYKKPTPTPTPVKAVISNPVRVSTKVTDNYLGTNVKKTTGKFVQPVLVTTNNNSIDKIKPVTPTRTITFKQATSKNPTLPVKGNTNPIYKTVPVSTQNIIDNVRKFKNNYITSPPTNSNSATLTNSKAGSGKSSGKWGGTGSLSSTSSLNSDEKSKKGITGTSYSQGSDKIKRMAKSYNTNKDEKM